MKSVYNFIREIYKSKELILSLAKNDFKMKYAGSHFGMLWAFVQPIATIFVFWFVFAIGFRAMPVENAPFILWFIAGLIPWFFFSDALMSATNSLLEFSYLVKKVVFKISILPLIKILSALIVHLFFIVFMLLAFMLYGFNPDVYWIQLIYYSFSMFMLVTVLSLVTAPVIVFFKDMGQIILIVLQFGMWLTPIMWNYKMVPENYRWILKLNPMYYIVEGYRDSLIYHVWFFERYNQTAWFWCLTILFFFIGAIAFKKLKPHFADVL